LGRAKKSLSFEVPAFLSWLVLSLFAGTGVPDALGSVSFGFCSDVLWEPVCGAVPSGTCARWATAMIGRKMANEKTKKSLAAHWIDNYFS
jgi:hypothetical protein